MKLFIERNEDKSVKRGLVELQDAREIALLHNILEEWVQNNVSMKYRDEISKITYDCAESMLESMRYYNALPWPKKR